ncbi:MAG: hypothetical protein AAGG99_05975 [Pseudomonadota bacterium]
MDDDAYAGALFDALPQGDALRRYIEQGYPTNHFLRAVLENDLMEAVARADDDNYAALDAYCAWLRTHAPTQAYGSPEKVAGWIAARGRTGGAQADASQ